MWYTYTTQYYSAVDTMKIAGKCRELEKNSSRVKYLRLRKTSVVSIPFYVDISCCANDNQAINHITTEVMYRLGI